MSSITAPGLFGAGGGEPWAAALRGAGSALTLVLDASPQHRRSNMRLDRWTGRPDAVDRAALRGLSGPVLDIGCGPGRMIAAALTRGLEATGLDSSPDAVALCASQQLPAIIGSVFDPVIDEGGWGAALLIDGNIGIGGDVHALLLRCAEVVRPGGSLVVETHADRNRHDAGHATLSSGDGRTSDRFPWAEIGEIPLAGIAASASFSVGATWRMRGRHFTRLIRVPGISASR